jgi:hypothetical protein
MSQRSAWIAKVFYGVLYEEKMVEADRIETELLSQLGDVSYHALENALSKFNDLRKQYGQLGTPEFIDSQRYGDMISTLDNAISLFESK